jgi:predicted dehydrogenase
VTERRLQASDTCDVLPFASGGRGRGTIALVGFGHMGRLHRRILQSLGERVLTCDPSCGDADFADIETLAEARPDLWIVATPTRCHLDVVRRIIDSDPGANLFVEKPICSDGQVAAFQSVARSHAGFLAANSLYRHSAPLKRLAQRLRNQKIRKIRIELSKNRMADVQAGRFVDADFGVLGYEGFHLLTILQGLVNGLNLSEVAEAAVSGSRNPDSEEPYPHSDYHSVFRLRSGMEVELATSILGRIHIQLPMVLEKLLGGEMVQASQRRHIPVGSDLRYRVVEVTTDTETRHLIYHPFDPQTDDAANRHLLCTIGKLGVFSEIVRDNHLANSVTTALATARDAGREPNTAFTHDLVVQYVIEHIANAAYLARTDT